MQVINKLSRLLQGAVGENITVTAKANNNTRHGVTYRLSNGQKGEIAKGGNLQFKLAAGTTTLRIFLHWLNDSGTGGMYTVTVQGDSGDPFPRDFRQGPAPLLDRTYTFQA